MEDNEIKNVINQLTPEGKEELERLLNEGENADGMRFLAAALALKDETFEILRPVLQDSIIETFNEPQVQMQLVQSFAQCGFSIDDLINHSDEAFDELFNNSEVQLSENKKDFFKFLMTAIVNSITSSTINPAHVVEIPVEICREGAKLPTYSTNGSAAMDIYSTEEYTIDPGQTIIIPTGIKVAIPHGYALLIHPRSGLSARSKLRIPNSLGLIDEDYHEEIGVIVENIDQKIKDADMYGDFELVKEYGSPITIGKGERIAQMRLVEVPRIKWREVNSLGNFEEDHGAGFGSSGRF